MNCLFRFTSLIVSAVLISKWEVRRLYAEVCVRASSIIKFGLISLKVLRILMRSCHNLSFLSSVINCCIAVIYRSIGEPNFQRLISCLSCRKLDPLSWPEHVSLSVRKKFTAATRYLLHWHSLTSYLLKICKITVQPDQAGKGTNTNFLGNLQE